MQLRVLPSAPWYSAGLHFTCTACGNCCTGGQGFVYLTPVEITRIARHLKLPRKTFLAQYCRTTDDHQTSLNERRNPKGQYDCVFLKNLDPTNPDSRGCSIYPVRPTQCRTFPFWPENLTSRRAWNRTAQSCPGINQGTLYPKRRIHSLRDAKDWPDNPPTSAEPA